MKPDLEGNRYIVRLSLLWAAGILACLLSACVHDAPVSLPTTTPAGATQMPTETPTAIPLSEPTAAQVSEQYRPGSVILDMMGEIDVQLGTVSYSFPAASLQPVRITLRMQGEGLIVDLSLVDMFNNTLAYARSALGAAELVINEFTLPYSGQYRLLISPVEGSGTCQAIVSALAERSGGSTDEGVNQSILAAFTLPDIYHTYRFKLDRGDVVTLAVRPSNPGELSLRMAFYGPDGRLIKELTSPAGTPLEMPGFVASMDGSYVALVSAAGDTGGQYSFTLSSDTDIPVEPGSPDIVYGNEYYVGLYGGDDVSVSFDGEVGDLIAVTASPGQSLQVGLYLVSPFGEPIAYSAGTGLGQVVRLNEVQLPYSGRYRLRFEWDGSGEAAFRVNRIEGVTPSGGGLIGNAHEQERYGSFESNHVFHYYTFDAYAGERISLRMASTQLEGDFDLCLALLGPDGRQEIFVDGSPGRSTADPELTDYELTKTGTYTIVVYTTSGGLGRYQLMFSREQ